MSMEIVRQEGGEAICSRIHCSCLHSPISLFTVNPPEPLLVR